MSKMRSANTSITGVGSYRPELEFEIMKIVMLRESYLKRLAKVLQNQKGNVNLNVIGLIDTLRETSIEALELIQEWEKTQFKYPHDIQPFTWNGQCYAEKMCEDYQFLAGSPSISNWLGFSPEANPFFIPPEAMTNEMKMVPNSFIVFGVRPPEPPRPPRAKPIMPKFVKSPYLTPIHNDLDVFPQNSLTAKSKKKDKIRAIAQASADNEQKLALDRAQDAPTDPWQTFISHELVERAMRTKAYLKTKFPEQNMFLSSVLSPGYSPSSSFVTATSIPPGVESPGRVHENNFAGGDSTAALPPAPGRSRGAAATAAAAAGSSLEERSFGGADGGESEQKLPSPHGAAISSPQRSQLLPSLPSVGDVAMETAAGYVASTSLFSQDQSGFDETQEPFRASLLSTEQRDALENPAMRMQSVTDVLAGEASVTDVRTDGYQSFLLSSSQSQGGQSMTGSATSNASQYWTPHEIKLQKAVRRRGGELFVLTAAGTKGRVKAPWRRTRFQRLTEDLHQMEKQRDEVNQTLQQRWSTFNEMQKKSEEDGTGGPSKRQKKSRNLEKMQEEIAHLEDSRKGINQWANTLRLQHDAYKTVIAVDDLGDLQKQRDMHTKLGDGQALEDDEMKAQRLEDRMAQVIQRSMKRALGKSIRRAIIKKRHAAAQVIQNLVRKKANEGLAFERGIRVTLAVKVQKLWRGRGGKEAAKRMAVEQAKRASGQLLTRVARGYLARKITQRKRKFIRAVLAAKHEVGLDCVNPDDLDKLADTIEEFQKNFTLTIPMEVISVLRGILYIFIGDDEDFVTVDNSGYIEPVSIFAGTAGWNTHRLLLRRKGKFLRRVRAVISHLSPPGPRRLEFCANCLRHLEAIKKIRVAVFDHLNPKDRQTVTHFYNYIINIKTAYDMQVEFPEYFVPVMPQWYKNLSAAERRHQNAQNERRVQKYVAASVDEIRKKYVKEGKAWRFVANARKINEDDTELAERQIEKALAEYNRLLYFFEKDESLNLQLKEGFVKSNEFGAIVAERDFKSFMDKEGDYAPEWRIAEIRLTVDKANLKLLEAQNEFFFANRAKLRDLEARNWKKHINLRYVHEMCRDEGVILGKLYIIKQEWQKFVRQIGGVQYVFDLGGEDLTYYEDTKRTVLKLLAKRRELNQKRVKEMSRQFANAAQTAHDARMSEKANTWDFPTDMESKAEKEEDNECRMRDADLEAKEARAAKRLRIPAAPFKPMMLLIDMRVPKSVARVLRERLHNLHFREVRGRVDNPELTLEVQDFMDQHLNVFMFVDRGTNITSRSFFLGYFRSLLYSLIPTPRVVALDAFLEMRFENWHTDNAADYRMLYTYNKNHSTRATLALGRLRRTAMVFRQFLLMESADEEKEAGCFEIMPEWLRPVFRNDLDDFVADIENGNEDAEIAGDDANTYMSVRTAMEHEGMILAATIAMLLDWWSSPVLEWKAEQVVKGCSIFLDRILDAPALVDTLWFERFPPTTVKQRRRIARATTMAPVWREITRCNFYQQPARYLLARWALEAMELVECLVDEGGGIDESFERSTKVEYARNLDWHNDVSLDPDTVAEQLIGELLESAMEDCLIYENLDASVVEYTKREELEDVEAQFFTAQRTVKRVRVYHSHTRAFVCVSVDGHLGRNPIWHSFDTMEMVDFVSMLQPNNTELYDGTVINYDVGENGKDKWWEVISNWARLERTKTKHNLILLRSRTLILTKLGSVNGHMCRFEIFEERFGELLILIHGLSLNTGTVYLRINREACAHLLSVADHDVEKTAIELKEAVPIAYLSTDRIQVKPSNSQLQWLAEGELEPKNIWNKPLQVSIRLQGGPGRLVGRKLYSYHGMRLCITIFEVTSASDITQLRLLIYELEHSQTIEIRLSDLEKIMLFNDLTPMIDQVLSRVRTVFCKPDADNRGVMLFRQDFRPSEFPDYIVEGDEEYDILDDIALQEARKHAGSDGTQDYEDDENGSDLKRQSNSYSGLGSLMPSDLLKMEAELSESDSEKDIKSVEEEVKPWHWAFYFNRSIVEELMGNLTVSINLNLSLEGFEFIVFDNRTLYEVYRLVCYDDLLPFFYGMSKPEFHKSLQGMDETVVMEITEELYQVLEVEEGLDSDGVGVLRMQLNAGNDEDEPLVICHLREHEVTADDMTKRSKKVSKLNQLSNTRLHVLAARDLASVSGVAARCPTAITKWNMREVHRTLPVRNDLDPDWNDAPAFLNSTKDKLLRECFLEIEVWDWSFQKAKPQDFLGCVRISGDQLLEVFKKGARKEIFEAKLMKSPRFSATENENVKGSILLFGVQDEYLEKIPEKMIPQDYRLDAAERKLEEERQRTLETETQRGKASGNMFSWGKSSKANSPEEKKRTSVEGDLPGVAEGPEDEKANLGEVTRNDNIITRRLETFDTDAALSPAVRKHSVHIQNIIGSASVTRNVVQIPHQRVRFSMRHKLNIGGVGVGNALLASRGHTAGTHYGTPALEKKAVGTPPLISSHSKRSRGAGVDSTSEMTNDSGLIPGSAGPSLVIVEGNEDEEGNGAGVDGASCSLVGPAGGGVHGSDLLEGSHLTGQSLEDFKWPGEELDNREARAYFEDGYDEDEQTLATYVSNALTDDTYTVANKGVTKRLRVELLQLEGLPVATHSIMVVVKFNGYVAGRSPIIATVPSVSLNTKSNTLEVSADAQEALDIGKKRLQVKIGNARTMEDKEAAKAAKAAKAMAADKSAKERKAEEAKAAKEAAKAANRARKDEDSIGDDDEDDDADDDEDGETEGGSMSKSKATLDDESFISADRAEEEEGEDIEIGSGKISERVRRADKGNLALFPTLAPVTMAVPPLYELGSCSLELEVWDMDSSELLGTADLRGSRLVSFVDGGSSANPGMDGEWVPVTDAFSGHTATFRSLTGSLTDLRIMTRGDDPNVAAASEFLYYELVMFSLAGIPRNLVVPVGMESNVGKRKSDLADIRPDTAETVQDDIASVNSDEEDTKRNIIDSSGIFVRAMFNGAMVGESSMICGTDEDGSGSNTWSWQSVPQFKLKVPVLQDLGICALRLEIISRVGTGVLPTAGEITAAVAKAAATGQPGTTASAQAGIAGTHFNDTVVATTSITGGALLALLRANSGADDDVAEAEVDEHVEVDETGVVDMQALLTREMWEPQEYKGGMTRRVLMESPDATPDDTAKEELDGDGGDGAEEINERIGQVAVKAKIELAGLPTTIDAVLDDSAHSITTKEETLSQHSITSRGEDGRARTPYTPNPILTPAHLKGLGIASTGLASPPGSANTVVAGWTSRPGTGPLGLGREVSSPADLVHGYSKRSDAIESESDSDASADIQRAGVGRRERAGAQPKRNTQRPQIGNAPNPRAVAKKLEMAAGGGQRLLLNSAAQLLRAKHGAGELEHDPKVTVMRQNCMAEVQDMPQRRLTLTMRAIEIQGKKPASIFTGNLFGMGHKPSTEHRKQSVALVPTQSRVTRGLEILKRYVDCAKRVSEESVAKDVATAASAAAAAAAAKQAEIDTVRSGTARKGQQKGKSRDNAHTVSMPRDNPVSGGGAADNNDPTPALGVAGRGATRRGSTFGHTTAGQRHALMQSRKRLFTLASQMTAEIEPSALHAGDEAGPSKIRRVSGVNEAGVGHAKEEDLDRAFKNAAPLPNGTSPGEEVAFDHLSFREVQIFFNGRFVHEVTVPIRYTESIAAFHEIFIAAANSGLTGDASLRSGCSSTTGSPSLSPSNTNSASHSKTGVNMEATQHPASRYADTGAVTEENPFEEKVNLFVPRGQTLNGCRLELVVWHLDKHAKKLEIMGLRLFEGDDLVRLFEAQLPAQTKDEDLRPNTAGLDASTTTSGVTNLSSSWPISGGHGRPNSAPGAVSFAPDTTDRIINLASPRTLQQSQANSSLYEMEAPPGENNENTEGIAISNEKLELLGAGEPDYTEVTSGIDLGVHTHSRGPGRRKVEIRLLALHGMLEGLEIAPGVPIAQFSSSLGEQNDLQFSQALDDDISDNQNDEDSALPAPMLVAQSRGFSALGMLRSFTSRGATPTNVFQSTRKFGSGDEDDEESRRIAEEQKKELLRKKLAREKAEEAADASREYVYVSVKWNGQEIRASQPRPLGNTVLWGDQEEEDDATRRQRLKKKKVSGEALQRCTPDGKPLPPQVDAVGASAFTMFVPRGHRLRGCYLELVVWSLKSDAALGSVVLHGDSLVGFLEGHGSVVDDDDFFEDYDESDAAGAVMHRVFPLKPSSCVPEDRHASEVRGRIVMRARCETEDDLRMDKGRASQAPGATLKELARRRPFTQTNPYENQAQRQFRAQMRLKKRTHFVPMFKIRSKLRRNRIGWRHFYSPEDRQRVAMLESEREEEDAKLDAMEPMQRAAYLEELDEKQEETDQLDRETKMAALTRELDLREWLKRHVEEQRSGTFLPVKMKLPVSKYHLSLSAVKYQRASEGQEEDCRVCWRGRAMPKHFKGGLSENAKETMMKSRASRLIRTAGISDLKMTADVHYLKDTDTAQTISNEALPIVVKEIVSTGPGLCTRVYRITIETNSGQVIGHTDLADDTDVIRVAGEKAADVFGEHGRDGWNMKAIFEHIVQERTIIDFMSDQKKKRQDVTLDKAAISTGVSSFFGGNKKNSYKKSSLGAQGENIQLARRGGVSSSNTKEGGHQVITVKRDEIITAGTKFRAIYGLYTFHRDLNAYEDSDMRDEARRATAIQDAQIAAERLERKRLAVIAEREREEEEKRRARDPFASDSDDGREDEYVGKKVIERDDDAASALEGGKGEGGEENNSDKRDDKEKREDDGDDDLDSIDRLSLSDLEEANSMDSDSDESSTVISTGEEVTMQYLRVHTRTKKLSGVEFKCTIMFSGRVCNLWSEPNEYFDQEDFSSKDALFPLGVEFRFKDTFTKITHEVTYTGQEILGWFSLVPNAPKIQLETRFRRNKFGEFLLNNTVMRYTHKGEYTFDLINDLIGEVTRQGMGGAAAGFAKNLQSQAGADERRAEEREAQKVRNIRLRKEEKYRRIKEIEKEKTEIERKLKEETEAKDDKQSSSMFGSFGFGGGKKKSEEEKKGSSFSMFSWK